MTITISEHCIYCNKEVTITIPKESFMSWKSGTLIQKAMANMSAYDREFLISKLCSSCQDKIFAHFDNNQE